jgi:hypothetical protein
MKFRHFFASDLSFLDPLKTEDGKDYGPYHLKELIKECYLISKNINTSYNDILDITPTERTYLLQFIADEIKRSNDAIEKVKEEKAAKRKT